jgi:anti-anti-sigma regulatory factor
MATSAVVLTVESGRLIECLDAARERLETADGELLLDFSAVERLDPGAVNAMAAFADAAHAKNVKVILRGLNVDAYKVLKLVKLSRQFSFEN